ncbi:hypothetical protein [Corynebacterium bovis]|uniref:Uncharacterized protein n=1 Tax=Corynebacterium bovis TaxID=36808 RepID=A0A3R8PIZ4_9CORY|nr:hypothetical protein [Corynebacterium bovis]RRO89779.1 hypothetical protein CXF40_09500 [Corynebacterium bovis]RRO97583.1 hypothetical protein CXF32_03665 [Corynebacterium bovis]RRO98936.1 hypothetical protein CXF31_03405 [Corynebacterium bovis]RRO99312.1 hypothetical protein CXF41_10065 [Corynebacterium bovis]RRQ01991.1 hypothetical protein CXF39_06805 [Corynebacterium bovis]
MADWLQVLVDFLTLLAAVAAALYAKKMLDVENARDVEREKWTRAEQARHIAAWPACTYDANGEPDSWGVIISNNSEHVAYKFSLEYQSKMFGTVGLELKLLPPGNYYQSYSRDGKYPGWGFTENVDISSPRVGAITKSDKFCVEDIRFTDSSGAQWRRSTQGGLEECTPAVPA